MFGLRKILLLGTLFATALSNPAQEKHERSIADWQTFQDLLNDIHPDAIHHALHSLNPKFQDGVFSRDRAAIEQVHSESPEIASKLVRIAKRQANNGTTATTPAPSPSTPSQSSEVAASSSRAASVSSALSSAIFASTVPAPTTILVAPTAPVSATPIATTNGAVIYSSFGGGLITLTSSAEAVSFTPSTSTHLYYTTLPDGEVETSTSIVVVNAPVTSNPAQGSGTNAAASASKTSTKAPGLQSGATRPTQGLLPALIVVVGGVLAFAMAL